MFQKMLLLQVLRYVIFFGTGLVAVIGTFRSSSLIDVYIVWVLWISVLLPVDHFLFSHYRCNVCRLRVFRNADLYGTSLSFRTCERCDADISALTYDSYKTSPNKDDNDEWRDYRD